MIRMRKRLFFTSVFFVAIAATTFFVTQQQEAVPERMSKQERIQGAIDYYKMTASDVATGEVPYDKLFAAINEGQRRLRSAERSRVTRGSISDPVWRERGPNNRGGRTRAIMIDPADPSRNRIWTGGVSGGVWRTEDITQNDPQWKKLGIYFESLSISGIAKDPNNLNVVYVSTGESYTGDVQGVGIFKSLDDGATWTLLPSTTNAVLRTVNEIYVHSNSDIYAATSFGGVLRSQDGGENWVKVIGTGINGATSNDFHDFFYIDANQTFFASNDNSIYKSTTGNEGEWTNIGRGNPGFPNNVSRIEFAVCPTDPDVIFAIGAVGSFSSETYVSNDGGDSWTARSVPSIFQGYGQAWYDLDIAVDPYNCNKLMAGGVNMAMSTNQGFNWNVVAQGMHVDHHNITFDPEIRNRVLFGNDGGIWLSSNGGQFASDRSEGYVTTQFYAGAIHPDAGSPYLLGGTQDNNSLIISEPGLAPSSVALGGDGVFCFIDQNEPNIQIVSSQNGNYVLSTNGGFSFGFGASVNGAFINRSDYDNDANILYGQINQSGIDDIDFFRWNINTSAVDEDVDITGYNVNVTAVLADPNVENRVYFGGQSGLVVRVDDAHTGKSVSGSLYANLPVSASVSSVHIDKVNPNDGLISLFNYGVRNVWVTYDDGEQWTNIDGDLPDIPVRWAIFDPSNHDRAMIATDAGVWTTEDIDGDNTHWEPTNPDNGMPFVRVDMLQIRDSDKVVLGATYGRGLMTTEVFSVPAPVIIAQPIAYEGQTVLIDGSQSINAQSFEWNLGDNTTSNDPVVSHSYAEPGTYTLTLTINGSVTDTRKISVLPYLPAPYEKGDTEYAGDFESHPEHFAGFSYEGTPFERGVSTKPGKDGTHSGATAWVLGIDEILYENNTRAELYTPMYDLRDPGLYEFKFWGKYAVQNRNDGFQIEYSTDGGASWAQLGAYNPPYWYNYSNQNLADGAFPIGKDYFTNASLEWNQYISDVSFLAGEPTVSFRFVFQSDNEIEAQGLAIDDFEITKYEGELKTTVTVFNADYTGDQEVTINWTTGIEYQCEEFLIERSYTGFGFTEVANQPAKNGVSTFATPYTRVDQSLRDVIYYRLRVINENPDIGYYYEFYTDTIVVRRDVEPNLVNTVIPNPFSDHISISFSSIVDTETSFRIFDMSGRLVREEVLIPNSVAYTINDLDFPPGVYMLAVQVEGQEIESYKLFTSGN